MKISKIQSVFKRVTISLVACASVVAFMPTDAFAAWGGTNLNKVAGGTDKVCVRYTATSTANDCDEYIDTAATYTLFNRFIDHPMKDGSTMDERNFVRICEFDTASNDCAAYYRDEMKLAPGKKYQVYIYFHNDASTQNNGQPTPQYTSHDAKVKIASPDKLTAGSASKNILGTISWDTPGQSGKTSSVWDDVLISSDKTVDLRYISGSAKVHMNELNSNYEPTTKEVSAVMSTAMFQDGTLLGHYDLSRHQIVLDGAVFGCAAFSGYITYQFSVEAEPVEPCPINPSLAKDDPACEPCPTNPDLVAGDPNCKPCPTNPSLAFDDPACKEACPINPSLAIDDPGCEPCSVNPNLSADDPGCKPCPSNPNLAADDPACNPLTTPPSAGIGAATRVATGALAMLAAAFVAAFALKNKKEQVNK